MARRLWLATAEIHIYKYGDLAFLSFGLTAWIFSVNRVGYSGFAMENRHALS